MRTACLSSLLSLLLSLILTHSHLDKGQHLIPKLLDCLHVILLDRLLQILLNLNNITWGDEGSVLLIHRLDRTARMA